MTEPAFFRVSRLSAPEMAQITRTIKPGDFISGLSYSELLDVEKMLKPRIRNVRILFTSTGYGYVCG